MIHTLTTLASGIELLTDLSIAAVALMALDKIATVVRWTYRAGRFTGRLWFTYGLPAFLVIADSISYVNSMIDWQFAFSVFFDCLKAIGSAAYVAGCMAGEAFFTWHAEWVDNIDYTPAPVAPAVNPLFDAAAELEGMTCKQLRDAFGLKARTSKAKLIGMALAI